MKDYAALEPDEYMLIGNYTPSTIGTKRGIIRHHNAGVRMSFSDVKAAFLANGTSAHYDCDADGRSCQYVYDRDNAWHAGSADGNAHYIGIEHADDSANGWTIAPRALEEGAHLAAALCLRYGWGRPEYHKNVYDHDDFTATACPGALDDAQHAQYMERAGYWYDVMAGASKAPAADIPEEDKAVYRLYSQASDEHLFTPNRNEAVYLNGLGWAYEGVGWHHGDGEPVLRLYNPAGEHVLTASHAEHDQLLKAGWLCEGESFGQGDGAPVHRLYSPAGKHMYTIDTNERDSLVAAGWKYEGVAFKSAD